MNDLLQYEHEYIIQTKTRHRTPIVRTTSITNVDESQRGMSRSGSTIARMNRIKRASIKRMQTLDRESGSSTPDVEAQGHGDSESSDSGGMCAIILDFYLL